MLSEMLKMDNLTKILYEDMKPALGVTEPAAIAYAVAKARSYVSGEVTSVELYLNSGMYKNAFTCGIPNTEEVGNSFAAALGAVGGAPEKELMILDDINDEHNRMARKLINENRIKVILDRISSDIYIKAVVSTASDTAEVVITDSHTNISSIILNGDILFEKNHSTSSKLKKSQNVIKEYTLKDFLEYVKTVDYKDIAFIKEAYDVNLELFEEGMASHRTIFTKRLFEKNGRKIISEDEINTAQLLSCGALEARVLGLSKPAMSITGSGAHGIIATLPLYSVYMVNKLTMESLIRSTALSYLITIFIKEYSGRLSAFCGCGIAAGTGAACGLVLLKGGDYAEIMYTINNMASSLTGMICDGGNHGCAMKGVIAVDAAFRSAYFSLNGCYIADIHGINGNTPEKTMKHMGMIASPGMKGTEKTIVKIIESKL